MRILLCDQKPAPERSLLLNIVHHVLSSEGTAAFTLVNPAANAEQHAVVALDELEDALAATHPDVLLVLADAIGLERARNIAKSSGHTEVIAITRTGYMMVDLDPGKLTALLRALMDERRAEKSRPRVVVNGTGVMRVEP
jgi:hypothetical protein